MWAKHVSPTHTMSAALGKVLNIHWRNTTIWFLYLIFGIERKLLSDNWQQLGTALNLYEMRAGTSHIHNPRWSAHNIICRGGEGGGWERKRLRRCDGGWQWRYQAFEEASRERREGRKKDAEYGHKKGPSWTAGQGGWEVYVHLICIHVYITSVISLNPDRTSLPSFHFDFQRCIQNTIIMKLSKQHTNARAHATHTQNWIKSITRRKGTYKIACYS